MPIPPEQSVANIIKVLEALNCGAMLVDRSGRIVHANQRLCEMARRAPEHLAGGDIRSLYAGGGGRSFIEQAMQEFEAAREGEFFLPLPDGGRLPVLVSGRQLGDQAPYADLRVITFMDISQRKAAEQRCRDENREIGRLSDTILQQALSLKHHAERLEQRVRERTRELHEANLDSIYMLAVASEARDADTGAHVRRIQSYSEAMAGELGLPESEAKRIGTSAILHDVGKISVPDAILKKPGPLTPEERRRMEDHTVAGEQILSDKPFFELARQIARSHHENWDGSGYPDRLARTDIPLAARIVKVVDVFDALTTRRVYKPAWSVDSSWREIRDGAGSAFDPGLARVFAVLYKRGVFAAILAGFRSPRANRGKGP